MNIDTLKKIVKTALDLEISIYTEKDIIEQFTNKRRYSVPQKPQLLLPEKPCKPIEDRKINSVSELRAESIENLASDDINKKYHLWGMILLISGCAWGIIGFINFFSFNPFLYFLWALDTIVAIISLCVYPKLEKKRGISAVDTYNKEIISSNKNMFEKYEQDLVKYNLQEEQLKKEYSMKENYYQVEFAEHMRTTEKLLIPHKENLGLLEKSLQKLYSSNVIYPKYRNIVALASITEYLDSGRCTELEGPNGAYNLYESELRQNLIINSLSRILDNLIQIKNNQYLLYQQLSFANQTVSNILSEMQSINSNTLQTAYFAEATAVAASADRVYVGVMVD